jgi:hypothetical protein
MTVTMITRRRDDLPLHLTGLVHVGTPSHPGLPEECRDGTYRKLTTG